MEHENIRSDSTAAVKEDPPASPQKPGNGRRRAGFILLFLVVLGIVSGFWLWCKSKTHVTTDNAFIESHIYSISARVPGTVAQVLVIDNQPVKKGDLLVETGRKRLSDPAAKRNGPARCCQERDLKQLRPGRCRQGRAQFGQGQTGTGGTGSCERQGAL